MERLHPITKGVLGLIQFGDGSFVPSFFVPLNNHNKNVRVDKKNDKVSMGILELENVGDELIPKVFLPSQRPVIENNEPFVFDNGPNFRKIFPNYFEQL